MALDWRILGFTAAHRDRDGRALRHGPGAARHARRAARRDEGAGARRSPARTGSRSATCWSSCRSRCRWCCWSAPGCSCARSRRWRISTSASTATPCSSPPSTSSRAARAGRALEPAGQAARRRGDRRPACRARRCRRSRRSAAAPGSTGSSCSTASRSRCTDKRVFVNLISPDWFKTYGTRLLAGRDFTAADKRGAPAVAIVNEAFARKFTGGANPIGRRVREPARPSRPNPEREIVGYVADAVYRSLREPVPPTMYLPFAQNADARRRSRRSACARRRALRRCSRRRWRPR